MLGYGPNGPPWTPEKEKVEVLASALQQPQESILGRELLFLQGGGLLLSRTLAPWLFRCRKVLTKGDGFGMFSDEILLDVEIIFLKTQYPKTKKIAVYLMPYFHLGGSETCLIALTARQR
jgi:hypothetical protein